jgi:signal transduction histidine kinase
VFLVSPKEMDQFQQAVPWPAGSILLKPVTRAILGAHLGYLIPQACRANALQADRDRLLGGLLQANLRLQEYDQQRTNFLARVVHEFRVPLTALTGFCGLLSAGEIGSLNGTQLDAVARMQRSIERMARMTNAILDLSVAGKREQPPWLREDHIEDCVEQVLKNIHPIAAEKHLRFTVVKLLPPASPLLFERAQIEQVLINLLDNACKATPRGGTIEISGYPYFWERRFLAADAHQRERRRENVPATNSYRIDIRDSGPGIRPDRIESIFEEYTSFDESPDRSSGLGLAIARLIVERHHGRIWASSQPSGALFSFLLPYRFGKSVPKIGPTVRRSRTA